MHCQVRSDRVLGELPPVLFWDGRICHSHSLCLAPSVVVFLLLGFLLGRARQGRPGMPYWRRQELGRRASTLSSTTTRLAGKGVGVGVKTGSAWLLFTTQSPPPPP